MKKWMACIAAIMMICMACTTVTAAGWVVPSNNSSGGSYSSGGSGYSIDARLIDDLATRSGPSTEYTGCGYYQMKGETVRAVSRAFDKGGVLWVAVEFSYSGATRRVYTGSQRLNLTDSQLAKLPEENMTVFIGYGTVQESVNPKWGPGSWYVTYTDRTLNRGDRVAVISYENDYYMVECYHTNGEILRCWIPSYDVVLD